MGTYHVLVTELPGVSPSLREAWDALPPRRGAHADYLDSHAWLAAWLRARPQEAARLRIPMVLDGDQPLALLPLLARTPRRWESPARPHRPRYRPVLAAEPPDPEALGLLAEAVARAGARELVLDRLPTRDPATEALAGALRLAGFQLHRRQRGKEYLAVVEGGWPAYRERLRSVAKTIRRRAAAIHALWDTALVQVGAAEGVPLLLDAYRRSWKGEPTPAHAAYLRCLVERAERLGWLRLFALEVGGVVAAVDLWYRLGDVATAATTAYDQRLAALSPGSVAGWWATERVMAEPAPRILDLMPGPSPAKEALAPDGAALVDLVACRRTVVTGVTFPLRCRLRHATRAALARARAPLARWRPAASLTWRPLRLREVVACPEAAGAAGLAAAPFDRDGPLRRYLAVATGRPSTQALDRAAAPGDTWWQVRRADPGGGPDGQAAPVVLVRLAAPAGGRPCPVREVVLVHPAADLERALAAVAAAVGGLVRALLPASGTGGEGTAWHGAGTAAKLWRGHQPTQVHLPALPWPASQSLASPVQARAQGA